MEFHEKNFVDEATEMIRSYADRMNQIANALVPYCLIAGDTSL